MKIKRIKLVLWLTLLLLPLELFAQIAPEKTTLMSEQQLKKMDRKSQTQKRHRRNFNTPQEFENKSHKKMYHHTSSSHERYYNGNSYHRMHDNHRRRVIEQRPYRQSKRGWRLAYKYDRAFFYDKYGYHYGYFNQNGYTFEDIFYRYDRAYTYRDRVKGRGLFGRGYYMPAEVRRYGFCR